MKNMMIIFVMTMGLYVARAQAQVKAGVWTQDYETAIAMASEGDVPVLLNFTGSDWCGWCKLMDKNVFSKAEWKAYAAGKIMLVALDYPREKSLVPEAYWTRNEGLKKQFGVFGFPTYVVLDSDGKTELGRLGPGRDKTASSFAAEVEQALQLSAASMAAFIKTLSPEDKSVYQAMVAEIKETEAQVEETARMLSYARMRLETLQETAAELKDKAFEFRAENVKQAAAKK